MDEEEKEEQTKKKKKRFNIFDSQREGKGVEKGEVKDPNLKNFFKYFGRSFTRLLNVNLMFTFFCLPLFFALFAIAGYFDSSVVSPSNPLASAFYGYLNAGEINPVTMTMFGLYGIQTGSASQVSVASLVFYGIAALTTFTWGYANAGTAYVIRNIQRGEPVFMWSDYWHTVKKNAWQALIVGVIDVAIIALLVYDIYVYSLNTATGIYAFMYFFSIFLAVLYIVMRFYIYPMLVTFDLSVFKLYKNAFIFTFVGLKRNVLGLLGVALAIGINVFILMVFPALGIVLPFALTVGVVSYISVYAAYPKIKEVMIDPYESEKPEAEADGEEE